jgi:hypothetical protein
MLPPIIPRREAAARRLLFWSAAAVFQSDELATARQWFRIIELIFPIHAAL